MDSRLIHEASQKLLKKVKWTLPTNSDNSEWIYIGLSKEQKLINQLINKNLTTPTLYLDINRTESVQTDKLTLQSQIENLIRTHHFTLWDETFTNVIQFNKSGIIRIGKII